MNKFLLARLKSPWAREQFPARAAALIERSLPHTAKVIAVQRLSPEVVLVSLQAMDFFGFGRSYHRGKQRSVTFDGFPLPNGRAFTSGKVAEELHSWLDAFQLSDTFERLQGEYSLAVHDAGNDTFTAFSDFSGLKPLYFLDSGDFTAVSNRQFLLNPLCTRSVKPTFDLPQAVSLITQGNKFGNGSIYAGIRLLRPGTYVTSTPDGCLEIKAFPTQVWSRREAPSQADYDAACGALVQNFNWMRDVPALRDEPLKLSLTGGEDSRLVLALALNSSVRDRVTTATYGYDDNPDIKVAQIVAEAAGVEHKKFIFKRPVPGKPDIGGYLDLLRSHAFRFEGAPGAWDGGATTVTATGFDVTGLFDFFYKRVRPSNAAVDLQTADEVLEHFITFQQPYDPLGLVPEHHSAREKDEIRQWIDARLKEGLELNDLPEIYYQENRITWWSGALNANVLSKVRISPLTSRIAASVGLKQSVTDRRERKFIFEMMLRLAPHLLTVPYLNKQWPDHFAQYAPHLALPGCQYQFSQQPDSSIPWQILLAKHGGSSLRDLVTRGGGAGLFDLVDREKVLGAIDNPTLVANTPAVRSIINIAELSILLTGQWKVDQDDIKEHGIEAPGLETNMPEFERAWADRHSAVEHAPKEILLRRKIEVSLPSGPIVNVRIDPLNRAGGAVVHQIGFAEGAEIVPLPLSSPIRANKELRVHVQDGRLVMDSSGADPHFSFDRSIIATMPLDAATKLIVDAELPLGCVFEVYFDQGNGFTREGMFSRRF